MTSSSKVVVFLAGALLLLPQMFAAGPPTGPLRVHPRNPRYFTDEGTNAAGAPRAVYLTGSHTWANLIDRGPSDPPPVFDFKLDPAYFNRLRARAVAAGDRGIYVGIMLFGGSYECRGGWRGNPFNASNNINGVEGDPSGDGAGLESHTLEVAAINRHPVGMTAIGSGDAESNRALSAATADWISPHTDAWGGISHVPAADGSKVSLLDSDHWFVIELYNDPDLGRDWVWKAFCCGHNPILMEHLPPRSFIQNDCPVSLDDAGYIASRRAMGQTRRVAERMNLAAMTPRGWLSAVAALERITIP